MEGRPPSQCVYASTRPRQTKIYISLRLCQACKFLICEITICKSLTSPYSSVCSVTFLISILRQTVYRFQGRLHNYQGCVLRRRGASGEVSKLIAAAVSLAFGNERTDVDVDEGRGGRNRCRGVAA